MSSQYTDRFGAIARLYGAGPQQSFAKMHLTVVGLGGVGSWVVEALARTGVGHLRLIDMDDICVTNTNRQLPATLDCIGKAKVEVLAERAKSINPEIEIEAVFDFVTLKSLSEHMSGTHGVVDAIDSARVKAAIIAWCKRNKIPVVTTGAAGGQLDPTQICVGDLNKTFNDPLARKVRSDLRRHHGFSRSPTRTYSVPCVFSKEQLRYPKPDGTLCSMKQAMIGESTKLDCTSGFGSACMVTGTFGFVAASEIIKRVLNKVSASQTGSPVIGSD
jgi:tRNA A37 threonylcarbamoyladenosine dehydratase